MHLRKATLNNFRCFDRLEIDLHQRLTVIVGANGAGKTAVLDGIAAGLMPVLRHLSSANQRLNAEGTGIKDTDFRLLPHGKRLRNDRWLAADYAQVILETTTPNLSWDYWRPSSKGEGPNTIVGQAGLVQHLKAISESLTAAVPKLLPVFAYYGAQRGRIEVPSRLRQTKENYGHPTSALVGALNSLSNFKEMLKWFDDAEAAELRANKGQRSEDFELSPALEAVRYAISQLLGGEYQNPYFNADHRFVIEKIDGEMPLQVAQLSQGYQSMLALGMDFARRLALANPHLRYDASDGINELCDQMMALSGSIKERLKLPSEASMLAPAIMLVDEVDLHLHPSWQQRVLEDLAYTFPMTQFIVTTHSPQVLSTVPSECIRILRDGKVHSAPPGSEGAEPGRLLKQVQGLQDVRPPANEATKELREYLSLVDQDQWRSERAVALRKRLDARYQGNEPELLEADLRIENRKWELGE